MRPSRLPSASSPTWSISAVWPRTGSTPPTSTCRSPATWAGRRVCWRLPRRWRSTDPAPLPATYLSRRQDTQRGVDGMSVLVMAFIGSIGAAPAPPEMSDADGAHRDQQDSPVADVSRTGRAGQPAQPPHDGAEDEDRQPDHRAVLEDGGPEGREADGRAGPGQLGPLAGQPRVGVLDVVGRLLPGRGLSRRRVHGTPTADSSASTAAVRPMTVMAIARIWGRRERGSGC